jgi:hypothetical protein
LKRNKTEDADPCGIRARGAQTLVAFLFKPRVHKAFHPVVLQCKTEVVLKKYLWSLVGLVEDSCISLTDEVYLLGSRYLRIDLWIYAIPFAIRQESGVMLFSTLGEISLE